MLLGSGRGREHSNWNEWRTFGWLLTIVDYSPASTFQTYFQNLWKQLQNPSSFFQSAQKTAGSSGAPLGAVRNISKTQVVAGGVILAECLGFFTVGEMIGRLKLIGYHGEVEAAHH